MQLSMTVLRCPDQVAPETRTVSGGEYHVGRGPDVDWVLPDPDRLLSKRHFAVAFRGGGWQVADTSTNGTFLNTEADVIGRGTTRALRDGDRLRFGAYEIEMRLVDEAAQGASQSSGFGGGFGTPPASSGQSPFGDPFGDDPMAPAAPPRRAFDEPEYGDLGVAPTNVQLPHDFDLMAPEHGDGAFGGFQSAVQSDHSSLMEDAMIPPPIASYTTPHTGGIIPGDDLLPDDWDKDLLEGIGAPQPAAPPAAQPVAPPVSRQVPDLARPAAPPPMPAAAPEPIPAPDPIAAFEASSSFESPVPFEAPSSFEAHAPFDEEITPFAPPAVESLGGSPLEHSAPPQPMVGSGIEAAGQAPSPVAAPVVRQRPPRPVAPPPAAVEANPFSEPDLDPLKDVPPFAASAPLAFDSGGDASPFDEPSDMPKAAPAAIPTAVPMAAVAMAAVPIAAAAAVAASAPALARTVPPAPVASGDGDGRALVAFFQGAELTGAVPADPLAMMKGLGAAFRSVVAGLRSVLIARATIKNEFRIEQTMIRAHGNNPLKFSANDDDALTALLGVGRRTDMTPAAAIDDALRDIRMHEVATMAAMQVAVRSILDELSPDNIRAGTEQGGLAILPAQRKARAWDVFEARHTATVTALADDFDSVFGKAFARAYERALSEISTREQR